EDERMIKGVVSNFKIKNDVPKSFLARLLNPKIFTQKFDPRVLFGLEWHLPTKELIIFNRVLACSVERSVQNGDQARS
uniref:Uncharacterized protein n=1 Tax=Pristionchus pacificus TaxID=54126 RepID=A0A2A6B2I9_PRIPA